MIESLYYDKKFKKIIREFGTGISILLLMMIILREIFKTKITTSGYYLLAMDVQAPFLIMYLFFYSALKKLILKIFRFGVTILLV